MIGHLTPEVLCWACEVLCS